MRGKSERSKRRRKESVGKPDPKAPVTTRSFSESSPDGFATDEPEWVSYCPRCGAKLPAEEHAECPYFHGKVADAEGTVTAIECAYPERPRLRERGRRAAPRKRGERKAP